MPKYRVKDGESILFHGQHIVGGATVIASYEEVRALKKKGINCLTEIKYDDFPVRQKTKKEDKPWMKSSKSKSKKQKTSQ